MKTEIEVRKKLYSTIGFRMVDDLQEYIYDALKRFNLPYTSFLESNIVEYCREQIGFSLSMDLESNEVRIMQVMIVSHLLPFAYKSWELDKALTEVENYYDLSDVNKKHLKEVKEEVDSYYSQSFKLTSIEKSMKGKIDKLLKTSKVELPNPTISEDINDFGIDPALIRMLDIQEINSVSEYKNVDGEFKYLHLVKKTGLSEKQNEIYEHLKTILSKYRDKMGRDYSYVGD